MIEDEIKKLYGDYLDGLDIYENRTSLKISRIVLKPEARQGGVGTKIMQAIVNYADRNKQIVTLTPSSDFGGNKNRLIQFYKRFGFKHNNDIYKSFEFMDSMIRYPKLNENMKPLIKGLLRISLTENIITPPKIPNTMNFWHGGNLDDFNELIAQKNGRYEYGPGLYLITHHDTALKYSKGSRKLYIVTVELRLDINDSLIDINAISNFINSFVITNKRKEILSRVQKYIVDGKVKGFILNNILINEKAIKPSNTKALRQFYIDNGIDYEIVDNPFGWGEKMMVLYNMNKIINTIIVKPNDKLTTYDF